MSALVLSAVPTRPQRSSRKLPTDGRERKELPRLHNLSRDLLENPSQPLPQVSGRNIHNLDCVTGKAPTAQQTEAHIRDAWRSVQSNLDNSYGSGRKRIERIK